MQVKKEYVRQQILRVSTEEFLKKGFSKASLREIAKKMDSSTGVIYTYFKSKEDIFETIVTPSIEALYGYVTSAKKDSALIKLAKDKDVNDFINMMFNQIQTSQEVACGYRLLFSKAAGTKFENFYEDLIQKFAEVLAMKIKENKEFNQLSMFTLRSLIEFLINTQKKLFLDKDGNKETVLRYYQEIMSFFAPAWINALTAK
ncbi:MAG: TetR/AcrR family transcriptional regulator [Flavobacteriales bacterium]|jgi:AcrR family transcriptional regulator|nr:TetR/AcrR family transcriptional regulator [Flavobacteriales bacterium]